MLVMLQMKDSVSSYQYKDLFVCSERLSECMELDVVESFFFKAMKTTL